jgi:hypothetical protein
MKTEAKIMAGKIIKTPHDFAPNDFANSSILTLSVSPQAHRQWSRRMEIKSSFQLSNRPGEWYLRETVAQVGV